MDEATSLSVYIVSASQDKLLREELEKHLKQLVKQGEIWHRHKMPPGTPIPQMQKAQIEAANVILCLLSIDFFEECSVEIDQAIACHTNNDVLLIPILLRAVDLYDTPFADLEYLPDNHRPVVSARNKDAAFTKIATEIRTVIASHIPLQTSEKVKKLKAMISDHRGFMQDRLNSFVGRQSELTKIQQLITEQKTTGGYVTITGQAGQGKSSIIAKLIELSGQESEHTPFHFIPLSPGTDHQVGLLRNLMARLILKYDLSDLYLASDNRAALRDYFPKVLQDIAAQSKQEVIFVDGLDQLEEDLNGYRDLSFLPTNPPAGIVFVLGTRPDDTLRPLELLKPFAEYLLPNLRREDFDLILLHRKVQLEKTLADRFYQAMEQNALYLDLAAKELLEAGHLAPEELIAHLANNPNNLFSLSIERFKRQKLEWREVLKPVFGVLLAAREPLGSRSIRSILQIEDERLRDGIQRLGGLLTDTGQHRYTLFHLKLRDYLRQNEQEPQKKHVFATDEEEGWHARLAAWCEQGGLTSIWENTKDAREQERRLYARKHLIAHWYYAQQWDRLFAILDEGSYGRAKERYDVSARSYIEDLNYGCQAASWDGWDWEEALQHLSHLWRYTLLRCSLRSRSDNYPDALFQLMLQLGREQEVIGHAELLTNPVRKTKIFFMLAERLSIRPERQAESKQFLLRMQEVARSVAISSQQVELVGILIQAKLWEEAEEVARSITESDKQARALREVAEALAKRQKWEEAEEVARSIAELSQQVWALRTLAEALGEAQRWEQAEGVVRSITESDEQAGALRTLAEALGEAQRWEQAEPLWEEAEKVARAITQRSQQAWALRALAEALVKAQRWEQAEEVARSIKESFEQAWALRALVEALGEAERWKQAEEVALSILESNEQTRALRALAKALGEAQKWEQAELLWKQAEEITRSTTKSFQLPRALRALVEALGEAQRWEQAEEVARSIKETSEQAWALRELAKALGEAQRWEQAELLWKQAEEVTRSITKSSAQAEALRALVEALGKAQRWEQAEEVARSIKETSEQVDALRTLVEALGEAQRWEQAEEMARSITESNVQAEALSALGLALIKKQHSINIENICSTAEEVACLITESNEQAKALKALVEALGEAQRWEQAEEVAYSITDSFEQVKALRALVEMLEEVLRWDQAEEVEPSITQSFEQAEALRTLAKALEEALRWEQAEKVEPSVTQSFQRTRALRELAKALGQAERWEQAEEVARSIKAPLEREGALSVLTRALGAAQRWEQAEEVARSITEGFQQAWALSELAKALGEAQRWEQAEEVTRSITKSSAQAEALSALAKMLGEAQRWEHAELLWEQAEEVARSITEIYEQAEALSELAKALGEAQRWEQAEEMARSITESDEREEALNDLIELFFKHKRYEQGLSFIQRLWLEVKTRESALQVFSSLVKELVPLKPEIGLSLYQEFQWVDAFLGGKAS